MVLQYTLILHASKAMPKQCVDFLTGKSKPRKTVGVRMPGDALCQVPLSSRFIHRSPLQRTSHASFLQPSLAHQICSTLPYSGQFHSRSPPQPLHICISPAASGLQDVIPTLYIASKVSWRGAENDVCAGGRRCCRNWSGRC